ncbi:hypothetical protein JG29_12960 [Bombilactobacillus mellis]|uniref:WxL domain-containing protein n=1 Tax=Bombilactobacillus mellis TaxID=1218508 RepID=A0A0F4KSP4_9LACO|nr:hypothetical protein [Bombilactobacillus mellis]KJY48246.1 hypothetical protein JG29_12960 [Bombilactobacillus mellis]
MKNWGRKLSYCLGATLCSALMATQSVQTVWADDSGALSGTTSASTNVTVTFTQAGLFIDRMPNFDFGKDNSLISAASSGVSLKHGQANQRSLIVNSPDAAVGFSVSVQCGKGYLYDPDSDRSVGTSESTSSSAEQKSIGTLTLNSEYLTAGKIIYDSYKEIPSYWSQYTDATAGGNIPLYIGDHTSSSSATNVFSVKEGSQGESGVNFNNAKSATFWITDTDQLDKLKNYFSTSPSTSESTTKYQHLNLIFPLQWTVAMTPDTGS